MKSEVCLERGRGVCVYVSRDDEGKQLMMLWTDG